MLSNVFLDTAIVILFGLIFMVLAQKKDSTTDAEIDAATKTLKEEIKKAEVLVGARKPHSAACREQLERARRCLSFNKFSSRTVVSPYMILERRNLGIAIIQNLIESMNSKSA